MVSRFLSAEWRNLLMLNYDVPPELLKPHLPVGTELDLWQGRALVSVVGFRFLRTRVLGVPIPFHINFDEVNLRFYTLRRVAGEVRRGVTFVREIVPRAAIAWVARTLYNENYVSRRMQSTVKLPPTPDAAVSYAWWEGSERLEAKARIAGEARPIVEGSEAQFTAEHYWGYSRLRSGATMEYEVTHPPWRAWEASDGELVGNVELAYGVEFAPYLRKTPSSVFVAEGSAVEVSSGCKLD